MDNFNSRDSNHWRFSREHADDGFDLQHIRLPQCWLAILCQVGLIAIAVLTLAIIAWNI